MPCPNDGCPPGLPCLTSLLTRFPIPVKLQTSLLLRTLEQVLSEQKQDLILILFLGPWGLTLRVT